MTREHAYKLREMIHTASQIFSDEEALTVIELFPVWGTDSQYSIGQRVRYNEKLYRCEQAHTSQIGWEPDKTQALWTEVAAPGEIPVWRQPTGAQDAYAKGDRVLYPDENGQVYESLIDSNVWSPEAYPAGWQLVS